MPSRNKTWVVFGLIAFGVTMRVLPYVLERFGIVSLTDASSFAWNISPVPAMCLLGGAYLSWRWAGFGLGLAAYLLSDVLIALVSGYPMFAFYKTLPFVYAGFILHGVIGISLQGRPHFLRVALTAVASELAFFLLTNFGEWAIGDMNYQKSPAGLLACYTAALPFLYRSLYGTVIYSVIFFEVAALFGRPATTTERALAHVPVRDE